MDGPAGRRSRTGPRQPGSDDEAPYNGASVPVSEFVDSLVVGEPLLPPGSDAVLEQEARERGGGVPVMLRHVLGSPWMARAYIADMAPQFSHVSSDDANLAMFAASQENACRYCYGAMRAVMRLLGYREAQIRRLERERQAAELGKRGRAVVDFARALARSNPRPARSDQEALLAAGFSRDGASEIALAVANACFFNRLGTFLAIPPDPAFEAMPDRWIVRLLRPLVSRKMRRKPVPPPPAPHPAPDVPFGTVVPALGPVPGAAALARTLQGAFSSDVLPRRAKVLVFAVVARALACPFCETEAKRWLLKDGIGEAEADGILAHLASPRLDPVEARLVPFARETVRYRPAAIHERTRELLDALGPQRLLEAVGTAALANSVVRLGMLASC